VIFNVFGRKNARPLTPHELEAMVTGGRGSATGLSVSPESAARFGAVFACVRVLAESVGQLPLRLLEKQGKSKSEALNHPLWPLLYDAPNEAMTSQEFWEWAVASLALRGNVYAFVNRLPNGLIYELLPLDARWVVVQKDAKQDPFYVVQIPTGFYADGTGGGVTTLSTPIRLRPDQVLHIKLMSLNGGITGASVIEQARESVALGMALEKHGARFFKNGAAPGGVLKTDQVLDDDTYDALEESWADTHGGIDNAHRIAILEAGLSWQQVGMPLKDAQFLEGRKYQRSEIAGLFRVPPHLIGDLERATFSNIEQQGLDFVMHGLQPLLTRIEKRVTLQLLKPEERSRYVPRFQVRALVRGDMQARGAFYDSMVRNGAYSPNDIREDEDMNPREGGDIYLTPMNMTTKPSEGDNKKPPTDKKPPAEEPPSDAAEGEGK
jgi:HK97 family phage portal protein